MVFDLVDYVSETGVTAAKGALKYVKEGFDENAEYFDVTAGDNVNFVVPQKIRKGGLTKFYMRIKKDMSDVEVTADTDAGRLSRIKISRRTPAEMIALPAKLDKPESVTVNIRGA